MRQGLRFHYLVGGPRISVDSDSNTPGPRSHIIGFTQALTRQGQRVELYIASRMPFMARFSRIRQSDYQSASPAKVRLADLVRILVALWTGLVVASKSLFAESPDVIYERIAVMQSLASFHTKGRRAVRVAEANGILSRETATDRGVLRMERAAAALERRVLRRADLVVAVSEALKRELVRFAQIDPGKVFVIPNGVDPALTVMDRERPDDRVIVGFVGSLNAWQHLPDVVTVFAQVAEELQGILRAELEIIGDGADRDVLQTRINELRPGLIRMYGRKTHVEVAAIMRRWSVGFAGHQKSSSEEMYHSPLKIYEYAALGMSVVCSPSADADSLAASDSSIYRFEDLAMLHQAFKEAILREQRRTGKEIEAARLRVRELHSWDTRAARLLEQISGEA